MTESVEQKLKAISQDQTHGASFLAREALSAIKLAALQSHADRADSFLREIAKLASRLIPLRPSMSAPIANGFVRAFDTISQAARNTEDVRVVRDVACEAVDRLLAAAAQNVRRAAMHASDAIPEGATVLTHSYSETCLEALLACANKNITVLVTESRPLFEGRRTATSLRDGGLKVTLITDAQAGHFMRDVQVVVTGADTVLPDGSVVNKVGTYLIALAAKDASVPFHVCCDSWKFRIQDGLPELEEKSSAEVINGAKGIPARNVYFDVTPARLITSLITEDGILKPEKVGEMVEKWRRTLQAMLDLAE